MEEAWLNLNMLFKTSQENLSTEGSSISLDSYNLLICWHAHPFPRFWNESY